MPTRPARNVQLLIDGQRRWGSSNETRSIYNPATEEEIGHFACTCERDLEDAAQSALRGIEIWSMTTARTRSMVLGRAAALLKKRQAIRTCGRTIPARQPEVIQQVVREPVGPVAALTPRLADAVPCTRQGLRGICRSFLGARTKHQDRGRRST